MNAGEWIYQDVETGGFVSSVVSEPDLLINRFTY